MTFDNSRTIISIRIRLFAYTVLFLVFLILTHIAGIIKYPVLGLSEKAWTLILTVIYIFLVLLPMILSYQYIFFSDEGEYIILRYFSAGIVGGRKNSVEIEKRSFSGYKIENQLFGLSKSITLFQKLNNGVAKYPPVFISALKRKEGENLIRSLDLHAPK